MPISESLNPFVSFPIPTDTMTKALIPSLLPIPRFKEPEEETHLPHARKIFALRNIHFRDITALGFDMDYTLSHYRSPEIDALAFKKSSRILVREKGYPAWLLDQEFDDGFAIRGLVLDGNRGNLLKLSRERLVTRACHGTASMSREEINAQYGQRRLTTNAKGFRCVDTLFEIPESHLYALLVDNLDIGRLADKTYLDIFHDVRWAIDTAHRNGEMKSEILAHKEFFILRDPELAPALDRWKRAGKKLFVLSNSEWNFTNGVLSFLLDGEDPTRPHWQDYFDLVVVSAKKPVFFQEQPEAVPHPDYPKVFIGGHADWLETTLGASGQQILYVGDHIYGDILRSKKNVSWHTMLLIPELDITLKKLEQHADDLQEVLHSESLRRRNEVRLSFLQDKLALMKERRHILAQRVSPETQKALDRESSQIKDEITALKNRIQAQQTFVTELERKVESAFNRRWGSLFRDGYDQTRFSDQIQQYACAYTGRISNLYLLDPSIALYAPVPALPHERI